MRRLNEIKNTIAVLKPILKSKFHVSSIGIFGSVARGDDNDKSDIDLIVDFNYPIGVEFIGLADYLEDSLHAKVDLVSKKGVKSGYFEIIKDEIIYV